MDVNDNELLALETVHLFVELLESYFSNVCELDIVFNFNKASKLRAASSELRGVERVATARGGGGVLPPSPLCHACFACR